MKDHFSKFKNQDLWCITENGFNKDIQSIRESQFSLGNGLLGSRGVLEEIPQGSCPGTYLAGIYDSLTSQVAELVNFPNPFFFKFTVKGEKLGAVAMDILDHQRVLNMKDGLLVRRTVYSDSKKRRYDYQSLRFVSMHNKNIGVMRIVITPLDDAAEIELQTGIDVSVFNRGVVTEGNKKHFNVRELSFEDNSEFRIVETLEAHRQIIYRNGYYYNVGRKKVYASDNVISLKLKKGKPAVFTKVFYINICDEKTVRKVRKTSKKDFQHAFMGKYETLLKKHVEAWHLLWDVADVVIEGTADIQKNLRFNIYHMLICAYVDGGLSSIGARTLSGEGYRGHIFWDAEIFLLPFYAYVFPVVAKNMLLYRYNRIEQARKIARAQGYEGIMFPWESAGTGEEETPTWAKDLDGSIIRIKTNELEHHITADIAYACQNYVEISDDQEFMKNHGYELIFGTARFWASRVVKNRQQKYEIRDVIGPDEFHEHVDNNAFTNIMARWNLLTGYNLYLELKAGNGKLYKTLRNKLSLTDKEVNHWKYIALRIVVNMRKDKVIEQFDGFFKRKYIEMVNRDENDMPLLPEGIKVKDYNKTQFVKQADVVMMLYLLPDFYNRKTKESNYRFYASRTLHKSSLSPAMHSLMASEIGELSQAYRFFNVALRADISNLHGNSAEGIHAASLGGVWQCVVNGFAGIKRRRDVLCIDPFMPRSWQSIQCSIFWRKNLIRIETKNNEIRIKAESRYNKKVKVCIFGVNHILNVNKEYIFHRPKDKERMGQNYYL